MDRTTITAQLDIVAVVQSCLNLERKGNNYVALCPFHDDKKPSLFVSEGKQIFKCFVCNVGGDAIKFWMRFYNYSYQKAVTTLGEQFNLQLDQNQLTNQELSNESKEIIAINEEAATFFQFNLLNTDHQQVKAYCQSRNINLATIKQFEIGWIGKQGQQLWTYLLKKQLPDINILNSDLFHLNKAEKPISYFRERLIFPIRNADHQVIGFVGRTITDTENEPKYLNSKENKVFSKSRCFYNLNQVKKRFKAVECIYLVEGLFDSIALLNANYPAVALMGVSLSQGQVTILKEEYREVVIFPDGDQAGKISAIKNSLTLLKNAIKVKIIAQDVGKDADECLQKANFNLEQVNKLSPVDFILSQYQQNITTEETVQMMNAIKPFLTYLSPVERFKIQEKIKQKYQLPTTIWEENYQTLSEFVPPTKTPTKAKPVQWKAILFARMLYHPEILKQMQGLQGVFNYLDYDVYYHKLIEWYNLRQKQGKKLFFADFLKTLDDREQPPLVTIYEANKHKPEVFNANLEITNDCLIKFQVEALNVQIDQLKKQLKSEQDNSTIFKELIKLRNKRNQLKNKQ